MIISTILVFNIIKTLKYKEGNPNDISYINKINDNLNYRVYLKPNNYIDSKYLDINSSYITDLVEYISTSFNYEYDINKNADVKYDYRVIANIIAEYSDESRKVDNPIWNKEFVLLESLNNESVLPIKINKDLNISIDYYNNLVNTFIQELNIPINCMLEVKLVINLNGNIINGSNFVNEHIMSMSIPLGVKAFDITISKNFVEEEIVYNKEQPKKEVSYMKSIIYIGILIIVIGISIYLIRLIIYKRYSKYSILKNKILKQYADRIVTVSNFIKYDKWEIVDVESIDELIDLSNEAFEPIFFWEKRYNHNIEAWFSILRDKVLYRYVISRENNTK